MFQLLSLGLLLSLQCISFAAATVPGALDTTFNPNGNNPGTLAVTFNNMRATSNWSPNTGLVIQEDGKIVLVGTANNGDYNYFGIGRFNTDGSLDTTGFNSTGAQPGTTTLPRINSNNSGCYAVALQDDGKIVVAGYAYNGDQNCFALARLNTDGSFDTTFNPNGTISGQAGFVITPIRSDAQIYSIAMQSDGKIVAAGYSNGEGGTLSTIARYNSDGSLDTTFGTEGIFILPAVNDRDTQVYSVQVDSHDGSIVVTGYGYGTDAWYYNFLVARITAQGALDTSFTAPSEAGNQSNVPGVVLYVIDSDQYYNYAYALVIQPDRKIVVTGYFYDWYGIATARLNPEGTLDTTFNPTGSQPGTGQYFINDSVYNYSGAGAIGLQKDGSIVVAGYGYPPQTYETTFAIARIKPNGQIDGTFAPNATHPGSMMAFINNWKQNEADATSLAIQKNGAIVVGGFAYSDEDEQPYFALARFNGGGSIVTDPYALLLMNNYPDLV